jgi:hypothetical protein
MYGSKMKSMSLHAYAQTHCAGHLVTKADLLAFKAAEGKVSDALRNAMHNATSHGLYGALGFGVLVPVVHS